MADQPPEQPPEQPMVESGPQPVEGDYYVVPPGAPPFGRHDWKTRAFAPGLDCGAIAARAERYTGERDPVGIYGEVAVYWLAGLYDKVVAGRLGVRPLPGPADLEEIEAALALAYAAVCGLNPFARPEFPEPAPDAPVGPPEAQNEAHNEDRP